MSKQPPYNSHHEQIKAFTQTPGFATECMAIMKVGIDQHDPPEIVMQHVIAFVLLKWYGLPIKPPGKN